MISYWKYLLLIIPYLLFTQTKYAQILWIDLLETYSEPQLVHHGIFLLTTGLFWILTLCLMIIDMFQLCQQYKIQPKRKPQWDWYKKAALSTIFSQFCFNYPSGFIYAHYLWNPSSIEIPLFSSLLLDLLFYIIIEEFLFYTLHRILHHPSLYKYIHKHHHLYTAPIGMAAIYAHPLEHLILNLFPVGIGPIILQHLGYGHFLSFVLWSYLVILNIVNTHSGYQFPFMPDASDHDLHHQLFYLNFGVLGILDVVFKTNKKRE